MKKTSETEQRIVATALKMFNASGIEYVGMRELAAALDMRIGNLTYYFPTKDDLVNRIAVDLAEENSRTLVPIEKISIKVFFEMLQQVFRNHAKYRCLLLSFVHIMLRNPIISKRYNKIQSTRSDILTVNIQALKAGKYLSADASQIDFLVSTVSLVARFWVSEAAISYKHLDDEQQLRHYTTMVARIFEPYVTARGAADLKEILRR